MGTKLRWGAFFLFALILICWGLTLLHTSDRKGETHHQRLEALFSVLDPDHPKVGPIIKKWETGERERSARALMKYLRSKPLPISIDQDLPRPTPTTLERASDAIEGRFTLQGVAGEALDPEGGIDWRARGPRNDREWSWFLNRHSHFPDLASAWQSTGDPIYLETLIGQLRDWYGKNPPPGHFSLSPAWRALETARRITESWSLIYDTLRQASPPRDEALVVFMLSLAEHGEYLRHHHHYGGNHLLTEMLALATIGIGWNEFRDSGEWKTYAISKVLDEFEAQVYPDGALKELSNHYQWIAGRSLQRFVRLFDPDDRRIEDLRTGMETFWDFFAWSTKPSGAGPLTNDSDIEPNALHLNGIFREYNRSDWHYIITSGQFGTHPTKGPTRFFPWAGQWLARSGWDRDADWTLFNIGPYGTDHQHDDRLHLSVSIGDRDFLVDKGRYTYQEGPWARYFRSLAAHNTIRFEGMAPVSGDRILKTPLRNHHLEAGPFQAAFGRSFHGWGGGISSIWSSPDDKSPQDFISSGRGLHDRVVIYRELGYWIVIDRVEAFGSQWIEANWNFHPDRVIDRDAHSFGTSGEHPGLRIYPLGERNWEIDKIRGHGPPAVRGWYAPHFNKKYPSPVIVARTRVSQPTIFAWLLWPQRTEDPETPEVRIETDPVSTQLWIRFGDLTEDVSIRWKRPGMDAPGWQPLGKAWIRFHPAE